VGFLQDSIHGFRSGAPAVYRTEPHHPTSDQHVVVDLEDVTSFAEHPGVGTSPCALWDVRLVSAACLLDGWSVTTSGCNGSAGKGYKRPLPSERGSARELAQTIERLSEGPSKPTRRIGAN